MNWKRPLDWFDPPRTIPSEGGPRPEPPSTDSAVRRPHIADIGRSRDNLLLEMAGALDRLIDIEQHGPSMLARANLAKAQGRLSAAIERFKADT